MFELRKIGIVRRASAWLLDAILLAVLTTGIMWIVSLICNYSNAEALAVTYYTEWDDFRKDYIEDVAEYYGFTYKEDEESGRYTITKDGKECSLDDVLKALGASEGNDPETHEAYGRYTVLPPAEKVDAQYRYVYSLLFMIVSVGLALSYLILEFVVPLFLKNGQTVGKKVFGICLVRVDCVKTTTLALFARAMIGKFAIETMFPILMAFMFFFGGIGLLAIILFFALLIMNAILFFATKNRTPIHDLLASTVVVSMKEQVIFDSVEELTKKKEEAHRERVEASGEYK